MATHRRRQWPQIGEDEVAQFLHRISLQLGLDSFDIFHRPIKAVAVRAIEPAVIGTAQPAFIRNAKLQIDQPMQASVADEPA